MNPPAFEAGQYPFDPLEVPTHDANPAEAHKTAKRERDAALRDARKAGHKAYGWRLTGQLRKYKSFGVEDGRTRTVYYMTVQA